MSDVENKLDVILATQKKIIKDIQNLSDMSLNRSLDLNKKLKDIKNDVNKIQLDNDKLSKVESIVSANKYQRYYSGAEIFEMHRKKQMSWNKISEITGLSISTLRSREKAYKDSLYKDEEVII